MPDINSLAGRIDAEFAAVEQKVKQFQTHQLEEHKGRQKRMEQLTRVFEQMAKLWKPRLEYLVQKFGDLVKVTPRIVPSTREAIFEFKSHLAVVRLRFYATTDRDVRKVILSYDLMIIPVLTQFTPHAEIEFPLDKIDQKAAAEWIEDHIMD